MKVFLLSPASLTGARAGQLLAARSRFALARRLRAEGLTLEEAFCFLSSLYFRGKLAYARRFRTDEKAPIFVIAPGQGLMPPETPCTIDSMRRLRRVRVSTACRPYRQALDAHARELAARLDEDSQVILLGSIASGKYIDVLAPIFGRRLIAPRAFIGIGDMSRGSLMFRAVASGVELDYMPLPGRISRHGQLL